LADFYADRKRWAILMQLWFLASRQKQLTGVTEPLSQPVVADYSFLKDGIFARFLIEGRELRLFDRLSSLVAAALVRPDLIVYLDATNEILLDRIRHRNRPYEAVIDGRYLDNLRRAYENELATVTGINVVHYDTSNVDLASSEDLNKLYETILSAVHR
jgi:deoxyguanosine kinase